MNECWLTYEEARDVIKTRLRATIGRSQAILADARASREVRFYNPANPVLLLADDGIVGRQRDVYGIDAAGRPVTHRISPDAAALISISEDDLLDWLDRHHPSTTTEQQQAPRGRRSAADWDAVELALQQEVAKRGFPGSDNDDPAWRRKADVEVWVAELLEERNEPIGESRIREKVTDFLKAMKAGN